MKLTRENIYINLQGKSKEELKELYWLLKNNNEKLYRDSLDFFLQYPKVYESFNFHNGQWCGNEDKKVINKQEVTIQQLKEILQPMEGFRPIAMKCTQEQFKAIKPKLAEYMILVIKNFKDYCYIVNNHNGEDKIISNASELQKNNFGRKVYEQWNEEIFLKACGIGVEPTLIEQLEKAEAEVKRLKEAIEEESKPKVGDWVSVNETNTIFKVKENDFRFIDDRHKKITNPQLIILLENEIK